MKRWLINFAVAYAAAWVFAHCLWWVVYRTFVWSLLPAFFFMIFFPFLYAFARSDYVHEDRMRRCSAGTNMAICSACVSIAVGITVSSLVYLCVMHGVPAVLQGDVYFVAQPLRGDKPWIVSVDGVLTKVDKNTFMLSTLYFIGVSAIWAPLMALLYYQVCRRFMPELPGLAEMGEKKQASTEDSSS